MRIMSLFDLDEQPYSPLMLINLQGSMHVAFEMISLLIWLGLGLIEVIAA
jgi:hypothetical protein